MSKALLASVGIIVPFILLTLWAILHGFRHYFDSPQERLLWICFAVFVPIIGGLAYLFVGRRRARGKMW